MRPRYTPFAIVAVCTITTCRGEGSSPSGPPGPLPDQPQAVDAGPDLRTHPGVPVSLTTRVGDPDTGRWTASWGDGRVDTVSLASGSLITATHVYTALGRYTVHVGVVGYDGDAAADTLTVLVEPPGTPEVFIGAGDIAACGIEATTDHVRMSGAILDTTPGTVFAAGDEAYPAGSVKDYATCYAPYWGRFKKRTHPVPGNHDYDTPGAAGYFGYYGVAAGDSTRGWYSFELGAWHIVMLNSNFHDAKNHIPKAAELAWLQADLAAHPSRCTLAMWHHPRFSSGTTHGSDTLMTPLWQVLYDAGADVIVNGHEHNYERFAPQGPDGTLDTLRGIREFVAGTGGSGFYHFGPPIANSQDTTTQHGLLKLTLYDSAYHWDFIPIPAYAHPHADSGTALCH